MAGKFEIAQQSNGKFYFNLKAGNGQVILTSSPVDTRADIEAAIAATRRAAADDASFERKVAANNEPYFSVKSGDKNIGRSETYSSNAAMENGIKSVKTNAVDATIVG